MEIEYRDDRIVFEKELTMLDELAFDFSQTMQEHDIEHVFVAGYVAILFGRSRVSEDVDLIVEEISKEDFLSLWDSLEGFYCHNTTDPEEAYEVYLCDDIAIRFSREDEVIPNVEFKFAGTDQHRDIIKNRLKVEIDERSLPIAPLESQISYKLYLGTEKDIEDAKYLFEIFESRLDMDRLEEGLNRLDVPGSKIKILYGGRDG